MNLLICGNELVIGGNEFVIDENTERFKGCFINYNGLFNSWNEGYAIKIQDSRFISDWYNIHC